MARTQLQLLVPVAVLLAAAVLVTGPSQAAASPVAGFGDAFTTIPKKVIGAVLGKPEDAGEETAHDHHHHLHHHDAAPKAGSSPAPAAAPVAAPAAAPAAAPTSAPTAAPTSAATAAPTAAASSTAAAPTTAATELRQAAPASSSTNQDYTAEQLKECRKNWLDVTNSTVNQNLDILQILLDNGGFPGQLEKGVEWKRNKTAEDPNRWTYFFGDTDYKTFIRVENGEVSSKAAPVHGTQPREVTGDIWWSPENFCGKLRHAKYSQDPELRASNQPKVCFIEGERVTCWSAPECVEPLEPGTTCPRGGTSGALMASLVG